MLQLLGALGEHVGVDLVGPPALSLSGRREAAELEQRLAARRKRLEHVAVVDGGEGGVVAFGRHVGADCGEERPFGDRLDVAGDDGSGLAVRDVVDVAVALRKQQIRLVDGLDVVEMDAEEDLLFRLQCCLEPIAVEAQ